MEELTNFCLDPLVNHVIASSVSADGYAPTNLTSTSAQIRARGFRVEHFIRPPVYIEFTFKVPVHVACILLKPDLEDNSEARFVFTGSPHTSSQKPNSASDGHYEFTLHSGVVAKGSNVVVYLKNKVYDRMWHHSIDISSDTVSMVTGSYLNSDLNGAHVIELPVKHLHTASRLRQLKVTATRLTGIKPFALKCIELWGRLAGTSTHLEKLAFHSALRGLEPNPHSAVPPLSLGVFNHHTLLPLEHRQQQVIACNDLHKVKDNGVSSIVTPPKCLPLSSLTCGSFEQPQTCHSQSSAEAGLNRPTLEESSGNPTTILDLPVKPCSMDTLSHYQRTYTKRGNTSPEATGCYKTKKPKMEAFEFAQDSLKPPAYPSTSSGCEEHTLNSNENIAPCTVSTLEKQNNSSHTAADDTTNYECTPSKFLDSITYDIMALPMLLPSGHYVDRSTIDKLAINDTLYGRSPTDPFTGVAFTETCKPEFSPGLKVEIDAYLYKSEFKQVQHLRDQVQVLRGRTVGDAADISEHLKMSQNTTFGVIKKRSHPAYDGMSLRTSAMEDPSYRTVQYSTAVHQGYDYSSPTSIQHQPPDRKLGHGSRTEDDKSGSFENKVSSSLDDALHQLFSS